LIVGLTWLISYTVCYGCILALIFYRIKLIYYKCLLMLLCNKHFCNVPVPPPFESVNWMLRKNSWAPTSRFHTKCRYSWNFSQVLGYCCSYITCMLLTFKCHNRCCYHNCDMLSSRIVICQNSHNRSGPLPLML